MKKIFFLVIILCISLHVYTQEIYKIYTGKAPGSENWTNTEVSIPAPWSGNPLIYNVTEPTITIYRPDKSIDTGAAMVIAPGGGNRFLTWKEDGTNVAEWFQRHGITGIILKYRTIQSGSRKEIEDSFKNIVQLATESSDGKDTKIEFNIPDTFDMTPSIQGDDGRQAIRYIRAHATELSINPEKVGLMGFSAGAMLTSNVIYIHDKESRPDLAAFIYGIGYSNTVADPMPLFMSSPVYDIVNLKATGLLYTLLNWKAVRVPVGLQFINNASHGEGLQYNGREWSEWIDNLFNFMKAVKFI